jgi:hypothetical protein
MARRRVVLVAAVAVAAGCGRDGVASSGAWTAVTDTVGDTVVVRTVAGSVWGDTARLVEELRIGSLEGEAAYLLGSPASIAVTDSVIYVVDQQVPVVRAYDAATGRHLRDIGRFGGGPGEYRSPDGVAALSDGRLLVRDPGNVRISVFAPDGSLLDEWRHPNKGGFHTYRTFYVDTAGTAWITTIDDSEMVAPWEWVHMLVGVNGDGAVTDTILAPRPGYAASELRASREHSASLRRVPFTAQDVWSFSPFGYMVGGVTGRYAVTLYRPEGALRIERDGAPDAPVHPAEAAERRAAITAGLQRQYGTWSWNGPDIPDTKTPWRDLFVDDEGRVWVIASRRAVEVMTAAEAEALEADGGDPPFRFEEPPAFDVFDRDGRFLGPVAAPFGLVVDDPHPRVRGDRVWAVVEDDVGIPYLVRFRLERPETRS